MSAWAQDVFREMSYSPKQTVFFLNSPKRPTLSLWSDGLGGKPLRTVKMRADGKNRWTATVKGDLKGQFYTFNIGNGDTPGVFAKAVGVNGQRGAVIDLQQTDPDGWANDHRLTTHSPADLVIYEMHHRDFSIASHAAHPGKFLALSEPWAVDYLKSLGVNAVHILPSFDFASVDETKLDKPQYNWGYDPLNYNVPEGSYSTDPYTPATRIREFKQMVQALHKAGIRVILDVVYNHTFDLQNSNFQRTWPNYFYRFTKDGKPSNGSGCGNETASEKPLMREFMLESVKYWAEEYHIDGFRFGLMGGIDDLSHGLKVLAVDYGVDGEVALHAVLVAGGGNLLEVVDGEMVCRVGAHVELPNAEIDRVGTGLYRCGQALAGAYRGHYFKFLLLHGCCFFFFFISPLP